MGVIRGILGVWTIWNRYSSLLKICLQIFLASKIAIGTGPLHAHTVCIQEVSGARILSRDLLLADCFSVSYRRGPGLGIPR